MDSTTDPVKVAARSAWAQGDYHAFARATIWEMGPVLVQACGIGPGQRVLDVAAGTGNTAIRAAETGASVVASDLTPENFDAGRREARAHGVDLEWVEADAENLPYADGEFDVVTSSFGVMFAPHHQAAADELVRVCHEGGTIGLLTFTPEGIMTGFFEALAPHLPPLPPDASPPLLWGSEEHVRRLFGDRVDLRFTRGDYGEYAASPAAYVDLLRRTFGPIVAAYTDGADDRGRTADLDRDLLDFATRHSRPAADGQVVLRYEYLLTVGHRR
ncbi:class I SAM-dependent methyltransferase [Ornithinimicrobium cavernae]|uniref:class I SAM-dependent methyltransferase n=1 Tax=Ornithinimicrobium cavernae TaxID=2666047 RepID=UPI000D6986DA|nr:methyltransferase domain-containing protein [Ornithinimicrobium cavernae]